MKRLILAVCATVLLASCGKSTDDYVGYWRQQDIDRENIVEIKKENGNYFLTDISFLTGKPQATVLVERDGKLGIGTLFGEMPINLSDDKKEMYVDKSRYKKIDAGMKDKIAAHQEECKKLSQRYRDAEGKLPKFGFGKYAEERKAAVDLADKVRAECSCLEKDIKCNGKPYLQKP